MSVPGADPLASGTSPGQAIAPKAASEGSAAARLSSGSPALRVAAGTVAGFSLIALTNAVAIAWTLPLPRGGVGLRLAHHAFDAAETVGLGALLGLLAGFFCRFVAVPWWAGATIYSAIAAPIIFAAIGSDLLRQSMVFLEGRFSTLIFGALIVLTALGFGAAQGIGASLSRYRWLRWLPITVGVVGMMANHRILADDYFGSHCVIAWAAATLAGAALGPLAARAALWLKARSGGRVALSLGAVIAAIGLFFPPSNGVRCELFRNPCSLAWVFAATVWRAPKLHEPPVASSPSLSPWVTDRSSLPPVPPTKPALMPRSPVVVLITIDALRADAINDRANDAMLPTFSQMKRSGALFTRVNSPGSQTAVSLSSTFAGRYFSELYWSMHGTGSTRFAYPADDSSPRFTEILSHHGVRTVNYASINFLAGDFGVTRGFLEERVIPGGRRHANAKEMIDPLLDRLRRVGTEPIFLYTHLTEPHSPYDRGQREGTDHQRYLSEVAVADAQIGRVLTLLQQRFADRAILMISADHGEAFGEHGTFQHTKTLYEELLRVPLLIHGKGVVARTIDTPVGLIDLGPTIVDLFGLETPATYLGQSLVPLLRGDPIALSRPLVAEGRLRRAMYFGESLKVIEDPRRKLVEVYDLAADPAELVNLFDRDPARAAPALAALRAFFAAHTLKREGYVTPYKP